MANIRKSFNFSSGVQVDNDNFVVSPVGLVGIGTSVPTAGYKLDVHGNIRSTGLTTTQDLTVSRNFEVSGITTVGFITASSMGITTDLTVGGTITANKLELENGLALDNIIGYAFTTFISDNAGIGLHTTSKIGLNTTTSPGASDSALEVFGDVNVTGVITATTFSGALSGTNITTGTISDARLPNLITSNINASSGVSTFTELKVGAAITMSAGIVTATTFSGSGASLINIPNGALTNSSVSFGGVSTSLGSSVAQPAFDLTNATNYLYNNLSGIVTSIVGDTSPELGGNLTLNSNNITGTGNVNITGIVTATTFDGALNSTNLTGTINNDRLPTTPQFTSVGIGTASPTDALHIQQSGAAEIYVGSDSATSSLRVGRNLDDNDSGMVKYGNTSGAYPYSTEKSLDFMNFGHGNVNFYLEAGITTTSDFNFNWNVGGLTNLMTLTKGGNLGIGITNPTHKLNVQGISTFTGNANFDQNVTIVGALSADSLTLTQSLTANITGDVTGNVTGNLSGDVNGSLAGISTFNYIKSNRVGIGTTTPRCALDIRDSTAAGSGFVLLPSQTTANRPGAGSTIEGSLIYNNTIKRFEFWNGTAWVGLTTEA